MRQDAPINCQGRAKIRRDVLARMNQPVDSMTLVVAAARLASTMGGQPFETHLQAIMDWILEYEYAARLARRSKRIKQPGTVAREITKRQAAQPPKSNLSPGEESIRRVINQSKKLGL